MPAAGRRRGGGGGRWRGRCRRARGRVAAPTRRSARASISCAARRVKVRSRMRSGRTPRPMRWATRYTERASLAGAGAGDNEERAISMSCGGQLAGIQLGGRNQGRGTYLRKSGRGARDCAGLGTSGTATLDQDREAGRAALGFLEFREIEGAALEAGALERRREWRGSSTGMTSVPFTSRTLAPQGSCLGTSSTRRSLNAARSVHSGFASMVLRPA